MKRLLILIMLLSLVTIPVSAVEYTAPQAPENALDLMPAQTSSFGNDLWKVITAAVSALQPQIAQCAKTCLCVFASVMLISLLKTMPGRGAASAELVGVLAVATLLLQSTTTMVSLAADTILELSNYGKLLLPVMTAALASQGGVTAATSLYTATAIFDAVLSNGISSLLVPMVYIFLTISVIAAATGQKLLESLRDFIRWLVTWCLKTILYIFTGYIAITGVVSGTTDAAAMKATKLTMSGMIPVVGGILSDASEAVIVGAGVMKNAAGVYGLLAFVAIWIAPFLRIGVMYLILKLTAALCGIFDTKPVNDLIDSFCSAMGLLLGMTGSVCIFLMISTVCFMKGVA